MLTNAKWITAGERAGTVCPEFRRGFSPRGKIVKATVEISALGLYTLYINEKRVSDRILTPGLTSYQNRIQYQTYDITDLLGENNCLAIRAGNGWALSDWYWQYVHPKDAPRRIRVIAAFAFTYENGETETLTTDENWEVFTSPVLTSELYHGETADYTAPIQSLGMADVDADFPANLIPEEGEAVREMVRVAARKLIVTPKGERVIDFGQNLAGYVEIRLRGKKGDRITLSHAEVLDKDGNFYTANYRRAKNLVTYVLSGDGEEILKPQFTFQGYRYIRLDEYPTDEVDLSAFTSVAVFSDMKRTGFFHSGNDKINQLYSNILWGQRSNFVDIPTDCPQRDERFGWTGDAEVFCRTAAIQYDVEKFFTKWLGDMMAEQDAEGGVGGMVPAHPSMRQANACGWGDAATICPFEIYRAYGNRDLLRRHYGMMKKWVEYIHGRGEPEDEYLWVGNDFHYGDWLAMDAGDGSYFGATQNDLVASAYFANSADLCRRAANILGEMEDEAYFADMHEKIVAAFRRAFIKDGMPVVYEKGDAFATNRPVKALTQTALALILRFRLCEEKDRAGMAEKLSQLIRENDGRMTTGFLGTAHILHALSENGQAKAAFDLLFQEKAPSWLFSVNHGATTMWEHWDSVNDKGEFWSTAMNSFNHYAYGAVYDWIFGCAAGIDVPDDGAGYTKITVTPHTDPRLGFIDCRILTRTGLLASAWKYIDDTTVRFTITVPAGTEAVLTLPSGRTETLTAGEYDFTETV